MHNNYNFCIYSSTIVIKIKNKTISKESQVNFMCKQNENKPSNNGIVDYYYVTAIFKRRYNFKPGRTTSIFL